MTEKGSVVMTETTEVKFPRYTFSDLKRHTIDPSKYVMGERGFIKKGACTLLVGSSGMGKSVFSMQMAMSIATGTDFLDTMKVHKARRVLLIEAENDEDILKRDTESIAKNLKLDTALLQKNLVIEHVFGTSGMTFADYLEKLLVEVKPEVVVVDPYQSYIEGDMNATTSFDLWKTVIDLMIKQYGVALVLVTHTGKPKDTKQWNAGEMQYLSMGISTQQNWARSCMVLQYNQNDSHRFKLILSKTPGAMGLKGEDGRLVDMVFVQHSDNSDEPYWIISDDQTVCIRGGQNKIIQDMILKYPELTNRDIMARIRMEHNGKEVQRQAVYNIRKKLNRIKVVNKKK